MWHPLKDRELTTPGAVAGRDDVLRGERADVLAMLVPPTRISEYSRQALPSSTSTSQIADSKMDKGWTRTQISEGKVIESAGGDRCKI